MKKEKISKIDQLLAGMPDNKFPVVFSYISWINRVSEKREINDNKLLKVKALFKRTQNLPHIMKMTEKDVLAEIKAYYKNN